MGKSRRRCNFGAFMSLCTCLLVETQGRFQRLINSQVVISHLGPVVRRADNAIQRTNRYPADKS